MHLFQAQAVSCYQSKTIVIFACIEYKFMARSPLKYVVLFNFPIVQSFKRVNKGRMVAQVCFINSSIINFLKCTASIKSCLKIVKKITWKCIVQFIFPFIFCFFDREEFLSSTNTYVYISTAFIQQIDSKSQYM